MGGRDKPDHDNLGTKRKTHTARGERHEDADERIGREARASLDVDHADRRDQTEAEHADVRRADRLTSQETQREPGQPRLVTAHLDFGVDIPYVRVAGTPPQLVAYYRRLVGAGMRYFIVSCLSDMETLRILAQEVMPQVAVRW